MKCISPRANFVNLPYDVHLLILNYLPLVNDIMSALKTCRNIYNLGLERAICVNILRRVCLQDGIFLPSLPLDTMSVSELKSAAMGPYHFLSLFGSQIPGSKIAAVTTRTLHLWPNFLDEYYTGFYLVPGGRYLITSYEDNLTLWDLSVALGSSQLVANIIVVSEGYNFCHQDVYPTGGGLGLRILLQRYITDEEFLSETVHFFIYDIYPLSPTPEFIKVADLKIAHQDTEYMENSLSGNYLVILDQPTIKVWDFVEDKSINITYEALQNSAFRIYPFISDNLLFSISPSDVCIWKTPELTPGHDLLLQSNSAIYHIPWKHFDITTQYIDDNDSLPFFVAPSQWYCNGYQWGRLPFTFEWVYRSNKYRRLYQRGTRYQLNVNVMLHSDIASDDLTITSEDFFVGKSSYLQTYQLCNSRLISLTERSSTAQVQRRGAYRWERGGRIGICFNRTALSESSLKLGWYDFTLLEGFNPLGSKHFSLCPFSGRICFSNSNFEDKSEVLVMDYLQ
ncbi:hypothetical protein BDQ17DRAFT_1358843 [Cyathus striatus]|nr:hypothetical protein BDQ17DRAFT_1358843 [Cyathus striatus]